MTVPAFSPSAIPPGAPFASLGAGVDASAGATGLFEGLLAGLTAPARGGWSATGDQDDVAPSTDAASTDDAAIGLDPSLAQMFAALGLLSAAPVAMPATDAAPTSDSVDGQSRFGDGKISIPAAFAAARGRLDAESSAEIAQGAVAAPLNDNPASPVRPETPTPWTLPDRPAAPQPAANAALAPPPPPPATPAPVVPAVIAVAAAPVVAAQAAASVETPAAPPLPKAGSAEAETRRLSGAARTDRRDPTGRAGAAATSLFAPKADALAANAATSANPATGDAGDDAEPPLDLGAADVVEAPETRQPAALAETRAQATQTAASVVETAPRGSPETVAKLAADIVRKAEGQSTRFDLQLDPHGLGKVDVAIEIDRDGRLTAAMSFDSAQSAADLRGRAGELRLALEQAGFEIAEGGLTFDLSGQNAGFSGRETGQQDRAWNGRAFQRAQTGADEADQSLADTPSTLSRWTRSGVDIRI